MSSRKQSVNDLEQFLAQLSDGELVSSGSFSLSSEKMLQKLAQAVVEPESWIMKVAQIATTADSGYLIAKCGKTELKLQVLCKKHIEVTSADRILNETKRTRTHHHLLLCLVWLGRMRNLKTACFRWSTADSVEQIEVRNGEFGCSTIATHEEAPQPFLEVVVCRHPQSLAQRIFRKANFLTELRLLESTTYLAPFTILLDNRVVHRGPMDSSAVARGLFDGPGSARLSGFEYPRRLFRLWDKENQGKHKVLLDMESKRSEATAYAEVSSKWRRFRLYWVLDGTVIQVDKVKTPFSSDCSFQVFLSAEGLTTDVSTLALTDSKTYLARREDTALWVWCRDVYLRGGT